MLEHYQKENQRSSNWRTIIAWIINALALVGAAVGAWWLIPACFFVCAILFWRFHRDWVRTAFIYAGVVSIVLIGAYEIHGWFNQKAEADAEAAKNLAAQNTKIAKPPAGTLEAPPNTAQPPGARGSSAKALADAKAELEKVKSDLAKLQADKGGGNDKGTTPPPIDDLAGISPEGAIPGEEGPLPAKAKNCWYSNVNEMTCKLFVVNKERQSRIMDVMDSQGTADNGEESRHFVTWRYGGAIRYAGGDNRAVLVHDVRNDILITFTESNGGVKKVSFTLNLSGVPDAIPHQYDFANIPVVNRWR